MVSTKSAGKSDRKSAGKGRVDKKNRKDKHKGDLRDNVHALGGDDDDLVLLKGVREDQMIQGGSEDVRCSTRSLGLLNSRPMRTISHIAGPAGRCVQVPDGSEVGKAAEIPAWQG